MDKLGRRHFLGLAGTAVLSAAFAACNRTAGKVEKALQKKTRETSERAEGQAISVVRPENTPPWKASTELVGDPGPLGFFLTSDDGSVLRPDDTLALAHFLHENGIKADFFINGLNANGPIFSKPSELHKQKLAAFIRQLHDLGHRVHNHTWNHTPMSQIDNQKELVEYLSGVAELQRIIEENTPGQKLRLLRYAGGGEPSLKWQKFVGEKLKKLKLVPLNWSLDSEDWMHQKNPVYFRDNGPMDHLLHTASGKTVLMHDRTQEHMIPLLKKILKEKSG